MRPAETSQYRKSIFDFGEESGGAYIAMEFLRGSDLGILPSILQRYGKPITFQRWEATHHARENRNRRKPSAMACNTRMTIMWSIATSSRATSSSPRTAFPRFSTSALRN